MSPLKNSRFGFCDWMPERMVANAAVLVTHSLSCGRMLPVRLGTPPWVVGKGFASSVVASGLPGSVRLSPTVAKLNITGSEACAPAIPAPASDAIATMDALKVRRKFLLFMKIPTGVVVIEKPAPAIPADWRLRRTIPARGLTQMTDSLRSHGSGFSDPVALDGVGRPGTLIHVHPNADLRRLIRKHSGDLAIRNAGLFAVAHVHALDLCRTANRALLLVRHEYRVVDLVVVAAGESPLRLAREIRRIRRGPRFVGGRAVGCGGRRRGQRLPRPGGPRRRWWRRHRRRRRRRRRDIVGRATGGGEAENRDQ